MKAKIFTLLLLGAVFGVANAQLEVLYSPDMAVTVDGVIDSADPWQEDGWVDQSAYSDASPQDHSSKFQLLHDGGDIIWLGVQVVDATPSNANTTTYENDCVEVFFHMAGGSVDGEAVPYGESTSQSRFQRDETDIANDAFFTTLAADADFEYAVVSDDAGYVLEVAFPIAVLDGGGLFDGENFMFEIQTADAVDGPRVGQAFWQNNSDNQWQHVETFSAAVLSDTEVVVGAVQSVKQKVASVYLSEDMLNFKNVEGMVNIYNISGSLVKKGIVEMNGTMNVAELKSGIYIVKSNNLTAKIIK